MEYGFYHPQRGYWQTTNLPSTEIVSQYPEGTAQVPLKPSRYHEWDGSTWVENAPDVAARLQSWRDRASISVQEFCIALKRFGVLSASEAKQAAKGEWPQKFSQALSSLPNGIDPDEAEIIWATTKEVHRQNPILLSLIPLSSITEEQVDYMFGWRG